MLLTSFARNNMLALVTFVTIWLVKTTFAAPDPGIANGVQCFGKYAIAAFHDNSDVANKTFMKGDILSIKQQTKAGGNTSCGGVIIGKPTTSAQLTLKFNYAECGASISQIQTGPSDSDMLDYALLFLIATDLSTSESWDFTISCEYDASTTASTNGTINGGHHNDGNGNNTGHGGAGTVDMTFSHKTAAIGTNVTLNIQLENNKTYAAIAPHYCYFSNSDNITSVAPVLPFIDDSCPQDSLNSIGITSDNGFQYGTNLSQYSVDFKAFRYQGGSEIWAVCVIDLCINVSKCDPTKRSCTTKWEQYPPRAPKSFAAFYSELVKTVGKDGTILTSSKLTINDGSEKPTTMYIVVGVVGGLFVVSLFIAGVLLARRRKPAKVAKVQPETQYIMPFQMPRAKLDNASIPSNSTMSTHSGSGHQSF